VHTCKYKLNQIDTASIVCYIKIININNIVQTKILIKQTHIPVRRIVSIFAFDMLEKICHYVLGINAMMKSTLYTKHTSLRRPLSRLVETTTMLLLLNAAWANIATTTSILRLGVFHNYIRVLVHSVHIQLYHLLIDGFDLTLVRVLFAF
jgi:hypothetical protein